LHLRSFNHITLNNIVKLNASLEQFSTCNFLIMYER
jgi:hypothetical protein